MEKLGLILLLRVTTLQMVFSQIDTSQQLAQLVQQNPSFQLFLKDNPQISQLLQSNPELVRQFQINPNLMKQTHEHSKFLNSFLQDTPHLPQIIHDNPNVLAFILKQVDHAVQTGEDKTIVIEMTEADKKEAEKELKEAQQEKLKAQSQNVNSAVVNAKSSANDTTGQEKGQNNSLTGMSREELLALVAKYQTGQQLIQPIVTQDSILPLTNLPAQQLNPSSAPGTAGIPSVTGTHVESSVNSDNIDINSMEDLIKIRALYFAMYNQQPKTILDLQNFYSVPLAQLNIRTRKQVDDFLSRFKISGQSNGFQDTNVRPGTSGSVWNPPGSSGNFTQGNGGYSNVHRKPTWRDRQMACKMRKFCWQHPWAPACRQKQ